MTTPDQMKLKVLPSVICGRKRLVIIQKDRQVTTRRRTWRGNIRASALISVNKKKVMPGGREKQFRF